jgi:hypothetical protein
MPLSTSSSPDNKHEKRYTTTGDGMPQKPAEEGKACAQGILQRQTKIGDRYPSGPCSLFDTNGPMGRDSLRVR